MSESSENMVMLTNSKSTTKTLIGIANEFFTPKGVPHDANRSRYPDVYIMIKKYTTMFRKPLIEKIGLQLQPIKELNTTLQFYKDREDKKTWYVDVRKDVYEEAILIIEQKEAYQEVLEAIKKNESRLRPVESQENYATASNELPAYDPASMTFPEKILELNRTEIKNNDSVSIDASILEKEVRTREDHDDRLSVNANFIASDKNMNETDDDSAYKSNFISSDKNPNDDNEESTSTNKSDDDSPDKNPNAGDEENSNDSENASKYKNPNANDDDVQHRYEEYQNIEVSDKNKNILLPTMTTIPELNQVVWKKKENIDGSRSDIDKDIIIDSNEINQDVDNQLKIDRDQQKTTEKIKK